MDESYIAAYGAREALLDLNTVKGNLDLSAMDPKVLETGNVEGTLVGAPIGVANFSVAANPEVLKKAGVSMPNDKTWTWDQFAQVAAQVTEKLGSQGVYGLDGFGLAPRNWAPGPGRRVRKSGPPKALNSAKQPSPVSSTTPTNWSPTKATPPAGRQVENSTSCSGPNRCSQPTRPLSISCSTPRSRPSARRAARR